MAVLRIQAFAGVVPVSGDRALPDGFATESVNTWLYGEELRGIRPPVDIIAINPASRRVFRVPKRTAGGDPTYPGVVPPPSYLGDSIWMQFTDHNTDIVRGQLVEDQYERYYFCSPSTGPMFNTYARMVAGQSAYRLGVPGPNTDVDAAGNNPAKPIISSITDWDRSSDLYEIEFKIADTAGASTSYSNPGGQGNRTATVTVTGTTQFSSAMSGLVDGNRSGPAGLVIANLADANKTIRFDFGTAKKVDELTWYQFDYYSWGSWAVQGSVSDAVTWVDLGSMTLGGATKRVVSLDNSGTVYRYYRLFQAAKPDPLQVTRAYLYTWVNTFGEESAPSLPATGAGPSMGVWHITNITDPPAPAADQPPYTKKYLYRTVSGASGQTTYYRVTPIEGIPIGTTVYDDNTAELTDAELVNNLTLESTNWQPPPANLEGFIAMPNGFLIGFKGSNIYFSEAYHFHAWPAEYKQATETPVVGLGVLGQTCVVCTQGYPATITGIKPATCSFTKSTTDEPCLSRGSIVSTPQGVIYASQNGLISVGPGGIVNVTEQLITRQEWIRNYAPQYLRAVRYQNGYLALRMPPSPGVRSGFYLDPTSLKVALTDISDFENVVALNSDFWSGEVFVLTAGMVKRWDPPSDDLMPVLWKSKEFQYPFEENFGAYAIAWDDARYSSFNYGTSIMPTDEVVRFKVYADRRIVYDEEVPRNGRPQRLPSGFKADIWQFELRARAPIYSLHIAGTMKELKQV